MSSDVIIRPYNLCDRQAVRKICCDTADRGEPVENFFPDRQIIADAVTLYYTDFAPQATWVAEVGQQIVGYLMGCLDTRHYNRMMAWPIFPKLFIRALRRGVFLRRETWRMLAASLKSLRLGGFRRNIPLELYPAHLHIDLDKDFRGLGLGRQLMEKFFNQARSQGVKGIHLTVREDNFSGCKFFERMGFTLLSRHAMLMPEGRGFIAGHTLVYGKIL